MDLNLLGWLVIVFNAVVALLALTGYVATKVKDWRILGMILIPSGLAILYVLLNMYG